MQSRFPVAVVVLASLAVASVGWVLGAPSDPAPSERMGVVEVETAPRTVVVHVAGEVARPGLVELGEGSRVADAIRSAGGLLPGASADSVNLARRVVDGERLVVGVASPAGREGSDRLRVNSASAAELEALPGVGPVLAGRIVDHRDSLGPFGAVEDLLDVPGIGEAMLERLRDLVVVP